MCSIGSNENGRSSGRSMRASSWQTIVRRVMSPSTLTLLPVANTVVLHSSSGASERPRMRTRTSGCSVIWQSMAPPRSSVTLSNETMGTPASSRAPSRFSVSSSVLPGGITAHDRPVAIVPTTLTR
jgi:hypothetical protein